MTNVPRIETVPPDPVMVAVAMLKEVLPAFESRIAPASMSIKIQGALPVGGGFSQEAIHYAVRRPMTMTSMGKALRDVVETDDMRVAREAQERKAIEHDLEPVIRDIVERLQAFGIDALNLGPVIMRREEASYERGRREGHQEGFAAGQRAGRAELLADAQEARDRITRARHALNGGTFEENPDD